MTNSEYIRGYQNTRQTLERMDDSKKEWLPDHLKKLSRNQEERTSYDVGAEDAIIDYQHQWEWKY
jgi:hypothetical protein